MFDNEESNHDSLQDSGSVQATGQHQPPRAMATLLENLNLQRASWDALEQHRQSNAQLDLQILDGRKVISIEMDEVSGWPLIELGPNKSGEPARTLRARLLVNIFQKRLLGIASLLTACLQHKIGADGYNSPVKAYSQIDTFGWPYDATGIVASMHVAPEKLGEGMSTMWQRFLPEGPIAFLPVSDLVLMRRVHMVTLPSCLLSAAVRHFCLSRMVYDSNLGSGDQSSSSSAFARPHQRCVRYAISSVLTSA